MNAMGFPKVWHYIDLSLNLVQWILFLGLQ